MSFCVGLDLGQSADYTALAVVEHVEKDLPTGGTEKALHLRHLERYPLGMMYPEMMDGVARLMGDERLTTKTSYPWEPTVYHRRPELVVDATGVGKAVTDMLKERGLRYRAVNIHGGDVSTYKGGSSSVPKRDLVAALEVPFHTGTLKVAEGLELWPTLKEELLNFRRKINPKTAHDYYEHWRSGDHDDLVLATALACWWIRRRPRFRVLKKPKGW